MIRFEWDPLKARANKHKHGVSFDIALHAFDDLDALVDHDRIEGGEHRWQTLGMVGNTLLLLVAHTVEFERRRPGDHPYHLCPARQPQGEGTL